jgi:hypothetical protein
MSDIYGQYPTDPGHDVHSYRFLSSGFENTDVHIERRRGWVHRNGKDYSLTVKPEVFQVNPQDPVRTDFIPADDYARQTNKLQHYWRGVANRVESLTGKRKAVVPPAEINNTIIETNFNDTNPLQNVSVNITHTGKGRSLDALSNYPNVVEFTLDTMKSVPAGVPSMTPMTGVELTQKANQSYQNSVNRFNPPEKK